MIKVENNYKKIFTRDQSFLIVESWYFAHEKGVGAWYQGERPKVWPIIFYMLDGAEETWHNSDYYQWICNTVQSQIKKDKDFVAKAISTYEKKMKKVITCWKQSKLNSTEELEKFIEAYFSAVPYFPVWYYAAVDERTPKKIRELALKTRNKDLFYDECDRLIRNTLKFLYPKLNGYESVILRAELQNPPAIKILKERKKNFIYIPGQVEESLDIEQFLKRYPKIKFIEDIPLDSGDRKEIKGQVAYRGFAKGRVKIIRRLDQMSKIKEGDILVSPMTTPNFLIAMKKSAAFVTEEGGLTCHAAIVARELKKPCIIGTKIATQVLKDGDLVEVDASKGVVKVINKSTK